jgi:hypothetical protein
MRESTTQLIHMQQNYVVRVQMTCSVFVRCEFVGVARASDVQTV